MTRQVSRIAWGNIAGSALGCSRLRARGRGTLLLLSGCVSHHHGFYCLTLRTRAQRGDAGGMCSGGRAALLRDSLSSCRGCAFRSHSPHVLFPGQRFLARSAAERTALMTLCSSRDLRDDFMPWFIARSPDERACAWMGAWRSDTCCLPARVTPDFAGCRARVVQLRVCRAFI